MSEDIADLDGVCVTRFCGPMRTDGQPRTMYQVRDGDTYVELTIAQARWLSQVLVSATDTGLWSGDPPVGHPDRSPFQMDFAAQALLVMLESPGDKTSKVTAAIEYADLLVFHLNTYPLRGGK